MTEDFCLIQGPGEYSELDRHPIIEHVIDIQTPVSADSGNLLLQDIPLFLFQFLPLRFGVIVFNRSGVAAGCSSVPGSCRGV